MGKILVLGGDSTLGKYCKKLHPNDFTLIGKSKCDITNNEEVKSIIKNTSCTYILNTAAITDIEYCETNKVICFSVNAKAVENLQSICKIYRKKLIHISSDYALFPVNNYGFSKMIGEKYVDKKSLLIRTAFYSEKNKIIDLILHKHTAFAYTNVFFNPISVIRLVHEIHRNIDESGTINVFSNKKISKYTFAKLAYKSIFDKKTNNSTVKRVLFSNKSGFAKRPLSSFVKTDISVDIQEDMKRYALYLKS